MKKEQVTGILLAGATVAIAIVYFKLGLKIGLMRAGKV